MHITTIIGIVAIVFSVLILAMSYKKQAKQEKNGVSQTYTETPASQMRRGILLAIPVLIIMIYMFFIR